MLRWGFGAMEVTRVGDPDFVLDLPADPEADALVAAAPWLVPDFVAPDGGLRVGSSAVVVRTPSAVVLVDPFLAFDDPAKLAPRLAALRAAGVAPEEVGLVINTHVDGVGANARTDGSPVFPNARYLLPAAELEDLRSGVHDLPALAGLLERGCLEPVDGGEQLLPGLHVEDAPGHNRGNVVVWLESGGQQAVVVGHLFLHPVQIAHPDVDQGDRDPVALARTRRTLLDRCERADALLVGPLFAEPGAGRVRRDGDTWRLVPA